MTDINIDIPLVRRLLATQFPQWADLPLVKVSSAGTDNAIYRLGNEMAVRLPRQLSASGQVDKELRWLPFLAPRLPLAVPVPLGAGIPAEGYPWHWSIVPWIKGETATRERITDLHLAASTLAQFITALHRIDTADGPRSGEHNSFRGAPQIRFDEEARAAIKTLHHVIDANTAAAAWEEALETPAWSGPPVWIHGDLYSENMLAEKGRLCAIIDFGLLGVGDPASDLMVAWTFLPAEARAVFRAGLSVDDATWARGRGCALSFGLIALAYYLNRNPVLADVARRTIDAVVSEYKSE
ncbi:MAG: aminoglycoside phosphotransferase family protein [Verrucomicrobia bacterium]|nr:aminoglycoside phosphotransferase family protein [Verrucomicrobiota bacterium]